MSEYFGDFICYAWDTKQVIHQHLSSNDVQDGKHRNCGKKVAIWRDLHERYDLPARRKVAKLNVSRWYTARTSLRGVAFSLGGLPQYPDPLHFLEKVIPKDIIEDFYVEFPSHNAKKSNNGGAL